MAVGRFASGALSGALLACVATGMSLPAASLAAQAPAAAAASARQIGTIQSIDATHLVVKTDAGAVVSIAVEATTKIVQLPPGSTDLKTAQPATVADLTVGDRVLALGSAGDTADTFSARRLVLMKSTDIAARRAAEQAGWQQGTGGLVTAIDPATGVLTLTSGQRTTRIVTTPATIFRRYAPASVRFEDATKSSLPEIRVGDQLRVRGAHAADGSITAEEIVSGSFRHLSGNVVAVNAAASQVTVRDLKTKASVILNVTPGTAIHRLPAEVAAHFARPRAATAGTGSSAPRPQAAVAAPADGAAAASHQGGGDLAQVVSRLPDVTLADLKTGDALLVVGSDGAAGSIVALTIVSGVEPILAASPSGGAELALSPWSMGGGEASGGAAQ